MEIAGMRNIASEVNNLFVQFNQSLQTVEEIISELECTVINLSHLTTKKNKVKVAAAGYLRPNRQYQELTYIISLYNCLSVYNWGLRRWEAREQGGKILKQYPRTFHNQ